MVQDKTLKLYMRRGEGQEYFFDMGRGMHMEIGVS